MKSFAHHYSSDISREQFELIRTDLEGIRKRTKPRKVDLYDIFCALLYTLKNGCVLSQYNACSILEKNKLLALQYN